MAATPHSHVASGTTFEIAQPVRPGPWYVVERRYDGKVWTSTMRAIRMTAGPYTSREAAQRRASQENWRRARA